MNPVETKTHIENAGVELQDVLNNLKSVANHATPTMVTEAVSDIVKEQVKQMIDAAMEKARPDIQRMLFDGIGPSIQGLIKDSVVSRIRDINKNVTNLLGDGKMSNVKPRSYRTSKKTTSKKASSKKTASKKASSKKTASKKTSPKMSAAKKYTKTASSSLRKGKEVSPTRGRFQIFDLQGLSAPFSDPSGRTFVACSYADGTERVYSLATIVKNKVLLSQILGIGTLNRVIGKL